MIFVVFWSSLGVLFVVAVVRRMYRGPITAVIELEPLDPRDIDYMDTPMDLCLPLSPTEVFGLMNFCPSPAKTLPLFDPMEVDADYSQITFPVTTLKAHTE